MHPETKQPAQVAEARDTFTRDPMFWLLTATFVVIASPYFVPGLDSDTVYRLGEFYGAVLLTLVTFVSLAAGVLKLPTGAERRFWCLLSAALASAVVIRIVYLLPVFTDGLSHILVDGAWLFFYFLLILALNVRPDRRQGARPEAPPWVSVLATSVFLAGMLVYFVLIPGTVTPDSYQSWVPSLVLYWALDLYMVLTLVYLHQTASDRRWRTIYAWLALGTVGWATTDLLEAANYLGWIGWVSDDSPLNIAWHLPYLAIGLAGRARSVSWPSWFADLGRRPDPASRSDNAVGVIVVLAAVLPLLHFLANLTGIMDEASRDAREVTVLVVLPLLLGIAFLQQRVLSARARDLELAGERLERERQLLSAAIEQSADAVLVTDANGIVAYANAAWEASAHRSRTDVVGRTLTGVLHNCGDQALATWKAVRTGGDAPSCVVRRETPAGSVVEDMVVVPVKDSHDTTTHFTVTFHDVTKESTLEHQLMQAQKMEALGTLAGGIAHDFNNILAAILGYGELIREDTEGTPLAADVDELLSAGRRAQALTSQILTFSRHDEAGRHLLYLGDTVQEAMKILRPSAPSTITIDVDATPGTGPVIAEEGKLLQVVMNLATNAIQSMGEKGTLRISVTRADLDGGTATMLPSFAIPPGSYTVVTVADDGNGMHPDTLHRMYDPFFTTKKLGHGTGLGLSVVHGIVKNHGGGISVESTPGKGTTFVVYLPCPADGFAAPGVPADSWTSEIPSPAQDLRHILLVDDEPALVEVLSRALTRSGFLVTALSDPLEVIDLMEASAHRFDALVTDQTMPGITGLELAKASRQVIPGLPVVLLTGFSEALTPERVADAGVTEVLNKPVDRASLVRAISDAISFAPPFAAAEP